VIGIRGSGNFVWKNMIKNKKKFFDITEPVYGSCVSVFVNWSLKEINAYLKKRGFDYRVEFHPDNLAGCFTFYHKKEKFTFITIQNFDWTIDAQGSAVHELLHFIFDELDTRGLPLTNQNHEAYTYLFTYYFKKLWKELSFYAKK